MLKKKLKAGITNLRAIAPNKKSPDELLGELFEDVQFQQIHDDGKTFVDLVSERRLRQIAKLYEVARQDPNFDLRTFVQLNFSQYKNPGASYRAAADRSAVEHIEALWDILSRSTYRTRGSLQPLPYPYIVPGGRFLEQFYWDSYFILVGLAASDRVEMMEDMIKNLCYLVRKVGFIPTGNRSYFMSRSQPPYFSHMIRLLAQKRGRQVQLTYLPYLLAEYRFWMKGSRDVSAEKPVYRRVVRLDDGSVLNRYYDNKQTPRPESYREDIETARQAPNRAPSQMYLDLRATAESGWDFSSRWLADGRTLATIRTTHIVPIDLNCLLYDLEVLIAETYAILRQNNLAERFQQRAEARKRAINTYCWNEEEGFFFDFDFVTKKQTKSEHLGAMSPLFSKLASEEQANKVADHIEKEFLKAGGVLTTLEDTGEQWDAPNGWAPLHWITYQGLKNYKLYTLTSKIKKAWIGANLHVYEMSAKFVEKYNVENPNGLAGGGEYQLQDGFGWTNAIFLAMMHDKLPGEDS